MDVPDHSNETFPKSPLPVQEPEESWGAGSVSGAGSVTGAGADAADSGEEKDYHGTAESESLVLRVENRRPERFVGIPSIK